MKSLTLFVARFIFLVATFCAVIAVIARAMVTSFYAEDIRVRLGATYSVSLFLIPNALAFAITAWLLRRRWQHLHAAQIFTAGLSLGFATFVVMLLLVVVFAPIAGMETAAEVFGRILMVAPGILVAQLLRLAAGGERVIKPAAQKP